MHYSELLYRGDRALFTFTERPPNSNKQSRWYFGISYHPSDGHSPDLHNPFHPDHQWIIYEYIPVTDHPSQPAQPPTSFAVHRPINDYHLQHRPLSSLNVLLPSSQPPPLGVTTQIIRDQWQASFHLLCHLPDELWDWVRDELINHFLAGRSREAEDGVVQDGQDFVKIVLAEGMRDEEFVSDEEFDEWWERTHFYHKSFREVEGFEVSVGEREGGGDGDGDQRSGERMPAGGRPGPVEMVSPVPIILPIPTPRRPGRRVGSGSRRGRGRS